jgi:GTP diphosphokinase / guanosine-3',5'-bis(diphosphate) 3'-diphosphatase
MLQKLLDKIADYKLDVNLEIIERAYNLAEKAHKDQFRDSGEPYIVHPIEVAIILVELGMDSYTICAALLHDVVEDTSYTYDNIVEYFNKEIANLVDGVTKLGKIEYKSKEEQQAENIRKMLIAMAKDVRVILIKLADRLHNMRTIKYRPAEKQRATAQETLDIYAPLAHRLGISKVKWELEDLSFRYLKPEDYYELVNMIATKRTEREAMVVQIVKELGEKLKQSGIDADIDGRPKHLYSIYRKMYYKSKTFDQIFDLLAVRVVVNSIKDCYGALGTAHTLWKPIPGRFKDYIAMPKPNMYQSLHSTVIGPGGQPFEIQIRTWEMHRTAEYGIAAHWKYKEGINDTEIEEKLEWIKDMVDYQKETKDAAEFMETIKLDLFSDEVFVFTPKGTVVDLPINSTPIDFAYRIHTDVGNKCVGAKVNGKMVPLDYKLNTGEIVEVVTSSTARGPSRDWLNIAKSSQAKSKIKQWFKKTYKEENLEKGRDSFEKEIKRQGLIYDEVMKLEHLEVALKRFNFPTADDMYAAIGSGALTAAQAVMRIKEEIRKNDVVKEDPLKAIEKQIEKQNENKKQIKSENKKPGINIKGEKDILVRFAKCCNPVPGDDVIGFITKGRGVSIHRQDCKNFANLAAVEPERVVDANWTGDHSANFLADVQIEAIDRPGLISEITTVLSDSKTMIRVINARTDKNQSAVINLTLQIGDIDALEKIMKNMRKIAGISDVYRSRS